MTQILFVKRLADRKQFKFTAKLTRKTNLKQHSQLLDERRRKEHLPLGAHSARTFP